MSSKKQKEEIRELLRDYIAEGCDSNHWIRRFYRCYIDGSYKGEEHYKQNCEAVRDALKLTEGRKQRRLVMLARHNFREFLQVEFPEARGIGGLVAATLSYAENIKLTAELINDLIDLVRE